MVNNYHYCKDVAFYHAGMHFYLIHFFLIHADVLSNLAPTICDMLGVCGDNINATASAYTSSARLQIRVALWQVAAQEQAQPLQLPEGLQDQACNY